MGLENTTREEGRIFYYTSFYTVQSYSQVNVPLLKKKKKFKLLLKIRINIVHLVEMPTPL